MKKQKPQDESIYNRPAYKLDRAMQEAAKRAASHPKPVAMTSNVPDFTKNGSNK